MIRGKYVIRVITFEILLISLSSKVGPFEDGGFKTVKVSSIRRNKAACRLVRAQQSAALALDIPISQVGPWILHRKIEVCIIFLIQLRTHDMNLLTPMTPSCEEEWSQLLPKENNQWLVSTSRYQGSNKLLQLLTT